jgi:hypothetical protein
MSYADALMWADADFSRLRFVAYARDYRPEWIVHQLEGAWRAADPQQAALLSRMAVDAGPYISRHKRWIMRVLLRIARSIARFTPFVRRNLNR